MNDINEKIAGKTKELSDAMLRDIMDRLSSRYDINPNRPAFHRVNPVSPVTARVRIDNEWQEIELPAGCVMVVKPCDFELVSGHLQDVTPAFNSLTVKVDVKQA